MTNIWHNTYATSVQNCTEQTSRKHSTRCFSEYDATARIVSRHSHYYMSNILDSIIHQSVYKSYSEHAWHEKPLAASGQCAIVFGRYGRSCILGGCECAIAQIYVLWVYVNFRSPTFYHFDAGTYLETVLRVQHQNSIHIRTQHCTVCKFQR